MNTRIQTSADSDIPEGAYISVCTELSSDALPKVENSSQSENSDTGVSTHFVPLPKEIMASRRAAHQPHWYALRVTYGREKKAYDYMVEKHVEAFYPTIKTVKEVNGKQQTIEESRLPNMFFARGSEKEIKSFVYDNVNLPYLRFYYRHIRKGNTIVNEPKRDYVVSGSGKFIDVKAFIDAVRDLSISSQDFKFIVITVSNECPRDMHIYPSRARIVYVGFVYSVRVISCFSTTNGDCEALDKCEEQMYFTLFCAYI